MIERTVTEAAARLRRHGEPFVVATVVRARRPGARLLLTRYRWLASGATGAAFDGELGTSAWMQTHADGPPVIMRYDAAHPDIAGDDELRAAFGLDDGDTVDVMLERAGAPDRIDVLALAARCTRDQERAAVATVIRADGTNVAIGTRIALSAGGAITRDAPLESALRDAITAALHEALEVPGATDVRTIGGVDVLVECIEPPPRLFVFGTGHDLVPLAQLARMIGWEVVVCAESPRHTTRERFVMADEIVIGTPSEIAARIDHTARAACVIASHHGDRDRACLSALLETRARFIGVIGRIEPQDLDDARVREIVGETPQDRALATIAEATVRFGRAALVLASASDRPTPTRPSAVHAAVAATL